MGSNAKDKFDLGGVILGRMGFLGEMNREGIRGGSLRLDSLFKVLLAPVDPRRLLINKLGLKFRRKKNRGLFAQISGLTMLDRLLSPLL